MLKSQYLWSKRAEEPSSGLAGQPCPSMFELLRMFALLACS